ncbi:DUF4272 domain-containing protein [Paenibacillus sp. CAA11]|uniref:DUF4272 domain-containing protein n=1 Tax=Paenibacillus sp. CAA11 TaxID=1532905 RepID=UPI000D3A8906|nr:DUF4272 domain-containing protein [Paenibacillus sp. CAA11]AWB43755.1 DUF4272 domain-containing protein [Paenibacillus sp. CAA11]
MRNCALYSSTFDLDQVVDILKSIYPKDKITVNDTKTKIQVISGGWFSKKIKGFNIMTSKTSPEEFEAMVNGMGGFFSQIQAENELVQQKLLIKISTLNMVIGIETEEDISDAFFAELLRIIEPLDGLMFWGGGQLLDPKGRLLMDTDGHSEVADYTVTAHTSYLHAEDALTESGAKRKQRSEEMLAARGVTRMPPMPGRLGDEAASSIRSLQEAAKRAVALCIVSLKGECVCSGESPEDTRQLVHRVIGQYGAAAFFSPEEKKFIDNDLAEEAEAMQYSWCYEGFWVMLWALGQVEEIGDPTSVCDVPLAVSRLQQYENFEALVEGSRLRSTTEILDAADLIYRYDWLCVDARIHGQPAPYGLDGGVVYERHRALNWLIGYMGQDWDDVRTDT